MIYFLFYDEQESNFKDRGTYWLIEFVLAFINFVNQTEEVEEQDEEEEEDEKKVKTRRLRNRKKELGRKEALQASKKSSWIH